MTHSFPTRRSSDLHSGGQFFPIGLGAQIYYAEGLEKLASNIEEVRPTIMVVVPRLFEVLRARILKAVEKQGKFAAYLLRQALRIGGKSYAGNLPLWDRPVRLRSEEHTSELQSLMRISYAVFCLKKQTQQTDPTKNYN